MLQCLPCPNFDWRKQWLLKPMVDLNDSSLADGSVLGHGSVAGEYQRQKLSGGGAVLLSKSACSSLPSAAAASLSQGGQGTPGTSSSGFWFCACLGISSSTSVLARAQGTSDHSGCASLLGCVLSQLCWARNSSSSFEVVPCSNRRVTALDVFVPMALAHPHFTSQLGHEQPVPCVAGCACAPSPRRI